MLVLATGHQVRCIFWEQEVRCIFWEQEAIFNKGTVFMWIKIICIRYILWGNLITMSMFDVANIRKMSVKNLPINDYELLNIQAFSFHVVWNTACTQSLVVSCRYWVVPSSWSGHPMVPIVTYLLKCESKYDNILTNPMPRKMWDEITYPFPNFNGATVEVWEWIS